jgi:hypothetical protein
MLLPAPPGRAADRDAGGARSGLPGGQPGGGVRRVWISGSRDYRLAKMP